MGEVQWSPVLWWICFMFHSLLTPDQAPPLTGWILSKLWCLDSTSSHHSSPVSLHLRIFLSLLYNLQNHPSKLKNILSFFFFRKWLSFWRSVTLLHNCSKSSFQVILLWIHALLSACRTNSRAKSKVCPAQSALRSDTITAVCVLLQSSQQNAQSPWRHE